MRSSRATIAYVGWAGHQNLGDDAIKEAASSGLGDAFRFIDFPGRLSRVRSLPLRDILALPGSHVLLGGGTVIGRSVWRSHLRNALAVSRRRPAYMLGAGVEDPSFQGKDSFSENNELRRWRPLLESFDRITVRGPRSAELLREQGIDAVIVGDPALLLGQPTELGSSSQEEPTLAICMGYGDDQWGHDPTRVVGVVAEAVRDLHNRGWNFRFLIVNPADRARCEAVITQAGIQSPPMQRVPNVSAFATAVAGATALLAERLHAMVLGAANEVPVVALEYQPKCLDFMASIGRSEATLRTDLVTAQGLTDRILQTQAEYPSERDAVRRAVLPLQEGLRKELERIRTATLGTSDL